MERGRMKVRFSTTRFTSSLESTEVTEKEIQDLVIVFLSSSVTSVLSSELAKRVVDKNPITTQAPT